MRGKLSLYRRLLDTHGEVWVLVCIRFCRCPPSVCFSSPVQVLVVYDGFNGDLLQEGLCYTQVCCTQSPCPAAVHCRLIPPQETPKHSLSQSLWGPWVLHTGLFEPSEHLWQKWGLILNANLPLLPSFWGFSFVLGRGVSPHGLASATQPLLPAPARASWTIKKAEHLRIDAFVLWCCKYS